MLKRVSVLCVLITVILSTTALAGDIVVKNTKKSGLEISVNGKSISFDTDAKPFIDDNSCTMIPIRAIAEALNYQVDWNGDNQTVYISDGERSIQLRIGKNIITVNGTDSEMDTSACIVNEYTYIPLRAVGEALDYNVSYTEADVDISTPTLEEFASAAGFDDDHMMYSGVNLIQENNVFKYGDAPDTYKDLLKQSPILSEKAQYIFEKDNIHISYEFYNFFQNRIFDMNTGLYEYNINKQSDKVNYYYSNLISNPGDSVLLEYIPGDTDNSNIANIYICHMTENGEDYGYIHNVGYAHVPINQHTIIKIDGLKNDRKYVVLVDSEMAEAAQPTIRIVNCN